MKRLWVMPIVALLTLGSIACGDDEETDPNNIVDPNNSNNTNNQNDMGGDADSDVGVDMAWPTETIGQVTVNYWQPDALYAYPELFAHAVFSETLADAGLVNPVGWLAATEGWQAAIPDDYWRIPALGESVDVLNPPDDIGSYRLLNAGEFVVVGAEIIAHLDEDVFEAASQPVYASNPEEAQTLAEEEDLSAALALEIEGGANIAGALTADAIVMPEAIAFTNIDPSLPVALRYGKALVVEWTPSADTNDVMLMTIETFDDGRVWHLDDDGSANITELASEAMVPLGDEPTISFSRILQQDVPTSAGVMKVNAMRKVWLYGKRAKPYTLEPKIWEVGKTTHVTLTYADGAFDTPTVTAGPNVTIENVSTTDTAGQVVEFDAVVAADATTGAIELIVEDMSGTPSLTLTDLAYVTTALPSAGDCESSVDEGPLPDGAYTASDAGLDWGLFVTDFCPAGDPEGREQTIPIALLAGERLEATLVNNVEGAMYIVKDCDDLDDVVACSSSPAAGEPTRLEYWATADENVLLVVDSYVANDASPLDYVVNITRKPATSFQFQPEVLTEGVTEMIQFLSFGGDFTDPAAFDFGPDVTVGLVEVFSNYAEVTVTAGTNLTDTQVDVSAQVGGTTSTATDSFTIAPYIASPNSCMAADSLGALGPGTYEGLTLLGGTDVVSPVPCLSQNADGMEGIFRVELGPSQTMKAEVIMPGWDPVIYVLESCDGEVLACSDNTSFDRSEYVEWTGSAVDSVVYLVVDGFGIDDSNVFYLDLDISL